MFFHSWTSLAQTVITGVLAYVALIVLLRTSGKRTLAKMNAFDLVVTVAIGSTLSTVLVSRDVPLANGVAALALLIGLQFAVAWLSVRTNRFEAAVKSAPSLLLYRGQLCDGEMRRQRVSPDELKAAIRSAGLGDVADVGAVVLETDGTFSVIRRDELPGGNALEPLMDGDGGDERKAARGRMTDLVGRRQQRRW